MRPAVAISLAALPTLLAGLEQSVMATTAPAIAAQIGADAALVWILAAFFVAASVATPIYGRLADHFGPIRVLTVAMLIFSVGSVLAAQSTGLVTLALARFVQGIGGGGLISLPQAFLSQTIAPRQRAAFQGYIVAIAFVANTLGPAVGGFLISGLGWRAIFWMQAPLALIAAALLILAPGPKPMHRAHAAPILRFDWIGATLLMGCISSLVMLIQTLSGAAFSGAALGWSTLFVTTAAGFVVVQRTVSDPLLPLGLLRAPIVWKGGLIVFLYGFLFTGLSSYLPVLLRAHYVLSPREIGILMMPLLGAIGVGSLITGQMVRRTGRTMIFPSVGLASVATILLGFSFALPVLSPWETAFWMGGVGLFMGSTLGVVQVALQLGSPAHMIGRATAFLQLSRTIGASVSAGIGGLIYFYSLQFFVNAPPALSGAWEPIGPVTPGTFSTMPFAMLFGCFAAAALAAAVTASRCRLTRIT
ncbi:MFS transporter [Bradyrhizobium sp. CNPSo 4010]|uniref:MFS transporter n=1 Tax=Bradyrhizobium agreste TaxID=2751811 RepID=A0ABS0PJ68_9BRAD|nr:MFS transporter [Bradyrhizobium agreste]MBH5397251.1 MFS transporter [Bradyrhizobium agreste]